MSEKLGLKDKNGFDLPNDCVVFGSLVGSSENHYFNLGFNWKNEIEMMSASYGYVHDIKQEDLINFEFKGLVKDNLHLLSCPC